MHLFLLIRVYKKFGHWYFDDEKRGLYEQPFGNGFKNLIESEFNNINADYIDIIFSSVKFDKYQFEFIKVKDEFNKFWYKCEDEIGWFSDVILMYFDEVPDKIYAKYKSIKTMK